MRHRTGRSVFFALVVLASALFFPLFQKAGAAEGAYLYGATQYGGQDRVDVRLRNAEEAVLVLGVYDRATHQLKACRSLLAAEGAERHILTVTLDSATLSTEYVRSFLLDPDTLRPLCIPVLADYVIPYPDDGDEWDEEEEPPDTEEDPSEQPDPGPDPDPGTGSDSGTDPADNPESRVPYATPTGKKYHYDPECGGKNSYAATWEEIQSRGLEPCSKCAK